MRTTKALRMFIEERFPLMVTVPLTAILYGAPLAIHESRSAAAIFLGWLSVFIAFLCIRIADDISDIDVDKIHHPERGLPSGRIPAVKLIWFLSIGVAVIVVVNILLLPLSGVLFLIGLMAYYTMFFYAIKRSLSVTVRPLFSNVLFGIVPIYSVSFGGSTVENHVLLALFIYFAVVAHEWAHNICSLEEDDCKEGLSPYSKLLGSRESAIIAVGVFALSDVCGWMLWFNSGEPIGYGLLLALTSTQIALLSVRLISNPAHKNARPFYIYGFTYYGLPLAGMIVEGLVKRLTG